MSLLNVINKTSIEATDFSTGSSDLTLRIPLSSGEVVQFTAETQFFTPRQIATSRSDVLGLPSESVVQYTANNIPVVKLPIGSAEIPATQYYPVSVVSDVYITAPIDNFFRELTDDLELPEDAQLTSLRDQRAAAIQAAIGLEDLAAAAQVADPEAFAEADDEITAGLAETIPAEEPDPSAILTPEEADELAALDLVGITDAAGVTDGADDVIDPTPEALYEDLIQKIPRVPGNSKVEGIDTINKAIDLLNAGIQAVEDSTQTGVDEEGNCKFITVAKKKKGFLGIGKKSERKVSRAETEKKLKLVKEDIAAQEASPTPLTNPQSGIKPFVKISRLAAFGQAISQFGKGAGFLGAIAGAVVGVATGGIGLAVQAAAGGAAGGVAGGTAVSAVGAVTGIVPRGYTLQRKDQYLKVLRKTAEKLEAILNKDCN